MDADDMRRLAGETGFDLATLEKDYALTWLLQGIYSSPLAGVLIFKGGTAIRKVYAPEWRLSEDLDFTVISKSAPEKINKEFTAMFRTLKEDSGLRFRFTQFHAKPYYVQARIQFIGPLGHKNTIKLDISLTEKLVDEPTTVEVDPEYGVPAFTVLVYSMDEILVEKIRSIMQRGYARDYYDVWRLLNEGTFDASRIRSLLVRKCEETGVELDTSLFFEEQRLAEAERHWETALARLTPDLPPFERVIADLQKPLSMVAGS